MRPARTLTRRAVPTPTRHSHPTTGPKGQPTTASGAVVVPGGWGCPGPFPLRSYSCGTELDRNRSMTTPDDREMLAVAALFAARGWVVVASARTLLPRRGVDQSGRLAVVGYSQGGHAALAIERDRPEGVHATVATGATCGACRRRSLALAGPALGRSIFDWLQSYA